MIEIYVYLGGDELFVLEAECDMTLTDDNLYKQCCEIVEKENGDNNFKILLIKHRTSFIRNISLKAICQINFFKQKRGEIFSKWKAEFVMAFGEISQMESIEKKKMVEVFLDEYASLQKGLDEEYNYLIKKKYGLEKQIQGWGYATGE